MFRLTKGCEVDRDVIVSVVLLNAIVGFVQEAKATQAMEALAKTMQSQATVLAE